MVARGSKVLFVAEKRAAIDAVLSRLYAVGLADLVLDIHEGARDRQRIAARPRRDPRPGRQRRRPGHAALHRRLTDRQRRLARHAAALHRAHEPWGLSAYQVQSALLGVPSGRASPPGSPPPELITAELAERLRDELREFTRLDGFAFRPGTTPWFGAPLRTREQAPTGAVDLAVTLGTPDAARGGARLAAACQRTGTATAAAASPAIRGRVRLTALFGRLNDLGQRGAQLPRAPGAAPAGPRAEWQAAARRWGGRTSASPGWPSGLPGVAGRGRRGRCRRRAGAALRGGSPRWRAWTPTRTPPSRPWRPTRRPLAAAPALRARRPLRRASASPRCSTRLAARAQADARPRRGRLRLGVVPVDPRPDPGPRPRLRGRAASAALDEIASDFRRHDAEHLAANRARVRGAWARRLRETVDQHPLQARVIRKQAALRRGHLPLRRLLDQAGDVLFALKPCWAMSPLMVSQVLPLARLFDLVIFDEASQVVPADAIGSMIRAHQVVVAGDDRQLPPTSFFHQVDPGDPGDDDDPDEEPGLVPRRVRVGARRAPPAAARPAR